ncbi:siderophore-interacting protein [Isoptericola sp. NPDC019693]|uniref:siderophore-interacting protein n=1 Tax=Isoptericola sp. NPDC019693 TaxID=3364009 RepID=UPI0037BCB4F7
MPPLPATYEPRIHRAEVTAARRVGPGMVRVTFGGADLRDFPTTGVGDEYVRLFFPEDPDEIPRLPSVSERGWAFADGVKPSEARVYTIRRHAPEEITVDFVVHDGGIAAAWASQARPGQVLGINPPYGQYELPGTARRQILVADEPGLPAALRVAEQTAGLVPTTLVLEVRGEGHRMVADVDGASYRWLCGTGNGQTPSQLEEALRRLDIGDDTYVWVATEGRLNRAIRKYLRHGLGLPAGHYKCIAYWQDDSEAWRARYDELGEEFRDRIRTLWTDKERDSEEIVDDVQRMYEVAGL